MSEHKFTLPTAKWSPPTLSLPRESPDGATVCSPQRSDGGRLNVSARVVATFRGAAGPGGDGRAPCAPGSPGDSEGLSWVGPRLSESCLLVLGCVLRWCHVVFQGEPKSHRGSEAWWAGWGLIFCLVPTSASLSQCGVAGPSWFLSIHLGKHVAQQMGREMWAPGERCGISVRKEGEHQCGACGWLCSARRLPCCSCVWFPWSPQGMSQLEHTAEVFHGERVFLFPRCSLTGCISYPLHRAVQCL